MKKYGLVAETSSPPADAFKPANERGPERLTQFGGRPFGASESNSLLFVALRRKIMHHNPEASSERDGAPKGCACSDAVRRNQRARRWGGFQSCYRLT